LRHPVPDTEITRTRKSSRRVIMAQPIGSVKRIDGPSLSIHSARIQHIGV
jgi:hypothetical protein